MAGGQKVLEGWVWHSNTWPRWFCQLASPRARREPKARVSKGVNAILNVVKIAWRPHRRRGGTLGGAEGGGCTRPAGESGGCVYSQHLCHALWHLMLTLSLLRELVSVAALQLQRAMYAPPDAGCVSDKDGAALASLMRDNIAPEGSIMLTEQQRVFLESLYAEAQDAEDNQADDVRMDESDHAQYKTCQAQTSEQSHASRTSCADEGAQATHPGSYERIGGRGARLSHEDYAGAHLLLIKNTGLGSPCRAECPFKGKCGDLLTKNDMYQCHEYTFGVTKRDPTTDKWDTTVGAKEKQRKWKTLMSSFVTYADSNGKASFAFKTASRTTCGDYARVAYGVPKHTWDTNLALLRKGRACLRAAEEMHTWDSAGRTALAAKGTSSRLEAISWWRTMLSMWDAVPSVIVHPRLLWDALYVSGLPCARNCSTCTDRDEAQHVSMIKVFHSGAQSVYISVCWQSFYVAEISIWGLLPLKSDGKNAPGSWYFARIKGSTSPTVH
eukprot:2488642-Pleurochrysis_carterae.AAC.2